MNILPNPNSYANQPRQPAPSSPSPAFGRSPPYDSSHDPQEPYAVYGNPSASDNQLYPYAMQPPSTPLFDPQFQQLIPQTAVVRHGLLRSSICPLVVLLVFVFVEISLSTSNLVTSYWFTYCYWNFSLNLVTTAPLSRPQEGDGDYSISEFYREICETDDELFPECPHLCESIQPLKNSMGYMIGFACVALIFAVAVLVIVILQRNKHRKVNRKCMYALNLLPLVLYICGFALYYTESGFEKHFDSTSSSSSENYDTSYNFTWGYGLIISIVIMCVMSCNFMTSKATIGSYYRN